VTPTTTSDPADAVAATYGLADLAARSGVSERNIRYYQNERLLPRPTKSGRDAVYTDEHLERLCLIGELRDRGLKLKTIRELVTQQHPQRTVSTWLGVDETLRVPWSDDRRQLMSRDEVSALVERRAAGEHGVIGELADAGYLTATDNGDWDVPSPALLDLALQLRAAGIDVDISAMMRDMLRRRLGRVVDDSVRILVERAGAGFAGRASPDELATALGALRPIARETASLILAQEVDRALRSLVDRRATS